MKHLLYSDSHWRPERLNDLIACHEAIGDIAVDYGVVGSGGLVINGGDTFHTRGLIHTECFDALRKTRKNWYSKGIKRHVDVIGNHDQADRDGLIHPMKIFEEFPGWLVVDKPFIDHKLKIAFIPYMRLFEDYIDGLPDSFKTFTAIIHAGVRDAWMNDLIQDKDGIPVEKLKKFKRVFSGHYHKRHTVGNVQYIGSPMQQSFSEMGQDKGVLIFDTETNAVEFVPVSGTPRHYEIICSWEDEKPVFSEKSHITDQDIVRVKAVGRKEQVMSLTRESISIDCRSLKISRELRDEAVSRIVVLGDDANESLIEKYVDHICPPLDRGKLLEIGRDLLSATV